MLPVLGGLLAESQQTLLSVSTSTRGPNLGGENQEYRRNLDYPVVPHNYRTQVKNERNKKINLCPMSALYTELKIKRKRKIMIFFCLIFILKFVIVKLRVKNPVMM